MIILRSFQEDLKNRIYKSWENGNINVMGVLPTGAGKTAVMSSIIKDVNDFSIAIAHRSELVVQISTALAKNNIRHKIIGSASTIADCRNSHLLTVGKTYIDGSAKDWVASVDTLVKREIPRYILNKVSLVVQDESHHVLKKNKWGIAMAMFPNARGLGLTATPCRTDGMGLGRWNDGLMDDLIVGEEMRSLIEAGWLTDYRVFCPPSDLKLDVVPITASGDYSPIKLANAIHQSHIVGDVVNHYIKNSFGKLGITFAVDVESAVDLAKSYRSLGVPAEVISAKTPWVLRKDILKRFKNRELLQLVNVDLFGEGFDLPALEVVSMARPTQSYSLFSQQFGRALRPLEGKSHAIIYDHVGNVTRHGLPDQIKEWSLERREKRSSTTKLTIMIKVCQSCGAAYERVLAKCPYCDYVNPIINRSAPEFVDGDLSELSPEALKELRNKINKPLKIPYNAPPPVVGALKKHHKARTEEQEKLREVMALWGGHRLSAGDDINTAQRRFYLQYGIDVGTAQTLDRKDTIELINRIKL